MVDQPTEEDRLNFVRSYGVEPVDVNTDLTFKDAAMTVAEMTPIIGDAMAAKEVYDELMKEDPNYKLIAALGGAALIGAIPGIGDAAAAGIRKAADTIKRIEVDPDAVGMMGGNVRLKPKKAEYDAMIAELDKAETVDEWQTNAKALIKEGRVQDPVIRTPELEDSTRQLLEGKITRDQHLANVDEFKPVSGYDQLPREPSDKAVVFGLNDAQRKDGHFLIDDNKGLGVNKSSLKVGDDFNGRLDIPAYNAYDVWIVTGNSKQAEKGKHYLKAVHYEATDDKPVRFLASEKTSERIGTGEKGKTPYATVAGRVKDLDVDAIRANAAELLDDPDWVQVGFDPRRQGGFYVRAGENKHVPVREATEVIQIGPLVLAKNAKLDLEYQGYSEGGMALEEQMAMNFGDDVPDNTIGVDPVSGNEIPLGSSAEEVRDDIPAQLSEGEMVMAADVVRFHGVKLFEDLRAQAKRGYAEMAEDGRIGGEPIPMESMDLGGLDIVIGDLEVVDDMGEPEEAFLGKFFAGIREANQKQKQKNEEAARNKVREKFKNAQERKSIDNIKAGTNKKPKFKNNFEKIMHQLFGDDDDDKPTPPKKKDKSFRGAGARSKIDFGFGGNPMERAARKYGTEPTETKNEPLRDKPQKPKYTRPDATKRGYQPETTGETFAEYLNFGGNYDEGGFATSMPAKTGQLLPDDYDPSVDSVGGGTVGGEMEMREYANAAGHVIMIPFMDGIPMAVIPEGYYPVGSAPQVVATGVGGGGSSDDDGPEPPEPFNYKELSIDELTGEVQNLQQTPTFLGTNLFTGIIAVAQKRHKNKTIKEIERRLEDSDLAIYEREHLENLLEVAKAPTKKGAIGKLVDKITGEETEDPDLPNLTGPTYDELPDQYGITEAYEPETSAEPTPTTTASDFSDKIKTEIRQASADAASKAFGTPGRTVEPEGQEDFIKTAIEDPTSMLPPTTTTEDEDDDAPDTGSYDPVGTGSVDDPSTRRRSGGGGRNKGGMMQKKKNKKSK